MVAVLLGWASVVKGAGASVVMDGIHGVAGVIVEALSPWSRGGGAGVARNWSQCRRTMDTLVREQMS